MNGNHAIDVDNLINRTQKEDRRKKRLMIGVFFLYLFCTILYAMLLLLSSDPELTYLDRLGGLFYVAAFLFGTIYFGREYLLYKKMDYTLPLMQLLEKTEKRYRLFNRKWFPISIIVLLIEAGELIPYIDDLMLCNHAAIHRILITQSIFLIAVVMGVTIGYSIWKKRTYPIWKDSKTLLEELKN